METNDLPTKGSSPNDADATTRVRLTVLAADALERWGLGRFAFEFATTRPLRERLALDYDHDDGAVVGYAEGFESNDDGIFCDATILGGPDAPARARELAFCLKNGVPFEVSPLVDFSTATMESVPDGATVRLNGREIAGPLDVARGATIRGVAICPHGTDPKTAALVELSARLNNWKEEKEKEMADEKNPVDGEQTEEKKSVNAELETMIEEFGRERGLDYYLAGKTLDEARAEDYEELKASRKSAEAEKKAADETDAPNDGETGAADGAGASGNETKKELEALKALVEKQGRELTALKAATRRGDSVGVSEPVVADSASQPKPANALFAAAEKFKRLGTTRKG
ncbi:MAG: hypothetical protein IIY07_04930 [Thermoguttaceae bacterium]|nr:hypothetical protein [Thermoguttaceae bacterium]